MKKYKEYTDEELINMYKSKDDAAIDELFERYKNLVRKKAKAMYIVGGDNDDLIQEGMIGLYKAVRDYDSSREASFMTFASMCINRQMCTAVSSSNRKKHSPLNQYVSLDTPLVSEMEEDSPKLADILHSNIETNPETLFINEESKISIEDSLVEMLSPFERKVLELQMEGMDYMAISKRLARTPKSVDNALQRIRKKLIGLV